MRPIDEHQAGYIETPKVSLFSCLQIFGLVLQRHLGVS